LPLVPPTFQLFTSGPRRKMNQKSNF
jgi:hypothetical protein